MTDSNSGEAEEKPSLIQQFSPKLAKELGLPANRIQGTLELLLSDNTIPFIARYRKEATGGLDEVQIGQIQDRYQYLSDLEERRNVILNSIREQEKLIPELEKAILDATCSSSTYHICEITEVLGSPSAEHVVIQLGNIPCRHGWCSSLIISSH